MPHPNPRPLRPLDVAVALRLAQVPDATFKGLGRDLLVSTSTAHHAVKRLEAARLVVPGAGGSIVWRCGSSSITGSDMPFRRRLARKRRGCLRRTPPRRCALGSQR